MLNKERYQTEIKIFYGRREFIKISEALKLYEFIL